ncbi:MAG: PilZ domain-containing protein [Polyangiaceae bacterium]
MPPFSARRVASSPDIVGTHESGVERIPTSRRIPAASPHKRESQAKLAVARARANREIERRRIYLGEGLTVRLRAEGFEVDAEAVDLTPEGMGVAVAEGAPLPVAGDELVVVHTGRATRGIEQRAIVTHVGEGTFAGKKYARLGLCFVSEPPSSRSVVNRRRAERYECPEAFPALASANSPLFFREWLHFRMRDVGAGGMTVATSLRNKGLIRGLELTFSVTLPLIGVFEVRGKIASIRRASSSNEYRLGIRFVDAPKTFVRAVSEYLMLGDKRLTPARLRKGGFEVGSVERAVSYDYASTPADYEAVLELRLRAHQAEGRLENLTTADMASSFDAHARHLTCRFGGRVVGYVRVIYVDGSPSRSQYVSKGGHEVPEWLWKAGFVEAGAGAMDPEFQRAGLFVPMMQHAVRVALQSGYRYMLGACSDELLAMYQDMGFTHVETRMVSPRPGWQFQSHLICIDMENLLRAPPQGKSVEAMASVVTFVGQFDDGT